MSVKKSQAKTEELMRKNSEEIKISQAKTDEQMNRTDVRLDEVGKKIDKIGKLAGNISNNQGDVAEQFFYDSLRHEPQIGGIKFSDVMANTLKSIGKLKDEFDIVLINGDSLAIIETKYKAHVKDVEKIKNKKIPNFRKLFPIYKSYKIYAGIASFYITEDVEEKAEEYGFFVLRRKGKVIEIDSEYMREQKEAG